MSFARCLWAIVALGAVVRVVHTLAVAPWPPEVFNDESYYATLGRLIARGEGFIRPAEFFAQGLQIPTAERAPLFPLALAGLAELGVTDGDVRLLGVLTGAGVVAMLGLLARRLAGDRAGLIAAGLAALHPTLIAADGALMTESLYGLLAAVALLAAYRVVDEPRTSGALVLGAVVGLAALVRAEALILLPLLLVPLVRRPGGVRAALLVCVAFAAVLTPWTARNWSVFDRPVLVATEGGETLAGANCDITYFGDRIGGWTVLCAEFSGRGNEAATLNELGRRGVDYALDHVGRIPVVAAARLGRSWGAYAPFDVPEGREPWVMHAGVVVYVLLLPVAAWGLVLVRRRGAGAWIIATPLLTVTLTTLLAYGAVRFRHSAELAIVVLAAIALDRMIARNGPVRPDR
jgi:4-amino-4-deoxy-L-arabinose transferase-like glycosyltransferase